MNLHSDSGKKNQHPPKVSLTPQIDIRSRFIAYFQKQSHTPLPSSSLVPLDDPTLLFTNAGMNQFKNVFLGLEERPYRRAVTVQKCLRAGGKHNDLENVGFTARHHTFFEMLGNFSFGDYFKKDAIHYAWEFLTRELQLDKNRLYVTVFETDDEAAEIWHRQEGVSKERIFRFDEKENFWRMGDTGPCGPCSEIYFDRGPDHTKNYPCSNPENNHNSRYDDPYQSIASGGDRFVEIWNLVFMQYYERGEASGTDSPKREPLPRPCVDTGAGLERLTAVLEGEFNNFDTSLFRPLILEACALLKWDYEELRNSPLPDTRINLSGLRVLADHTRAAGFLIADGVIPSNEGRGYVLRRILRRAIRYGRKLSPDISFLAPLAEVLINLMGPHYGELIQSRPLILEVLADEERRFALTLDQGTLILSQELAQLKSRSLKRVPGALAFQLYDTYGFPLDLTQVMAREEGLEVEESEFLAALNEAKTKSKSSWKGKGIEAGSDSDATLLHNWTHSFQEKGLSFTGYESLETDGQVLGLMKITPSGLVPTKALLRGERGYLMTDKTPFYAEGGGQVGDQGKITTKTKTVVGPEVDIDVEDTMRINNLSVHQVHIKSGVLRFQDPIHLKVYSPWRKQVAAHHSATHLLHAAIRKMLGDHVSQAGSAVDSHRLRFDFKHQKGVSPEDLVKIENLVNAQIEANLPVTTKLMSLTEAQTCGAMALFGEKYGDQVRVLQMGEFSLELCGGTHVSNTSQIRLFKILSESGVSAGIRRIEALAGQAAIDFVLHHTQENLSAWASIGDKKTKTLGQWIDEKKNEIRSLQLQIKNLKISHWDYQSLASGGLYLPVPTLPSTSSSPVSPVPSSPSLYLLIKFLDIEDEDRETLLTLSDGLKNKLSTSAVIVLVGHHALVVTLTPDLTRPPVQKLFPSLSAPQILKRLTQKWGGKGGGRPDLAQGTILEREALLQWWREATIKTTATGEAKELLALVGAGGS